MQRYRASSYRLLEQISQGSSDEEYREQAKRALNQFALYWKAFLSACPPLSTRPWSMWTWHRPPDPLPKSDRRIPNGAAILLVTLFFLP